MKTVGSMGRSPWGGVGTAILRGQCPDSEIRRIKFRPAAGHKLLILVASLSQKFGDEFLGQNTGPCPAVPPSLRSSPWRQSRSLAPFMPRTASEIVATAKNAAKVARLGMVQ